MTTQQRKTSVDEYHLLADGQLVRCMRAHQVIIQKLYEETGEIQRMVTAHMERYNAMMRVLVSRHGDYTIEKHIPRRQKPKEEAA